MLKLVLRQLLRTACVVAVLYSLMLVVSLLVIPPSTDSGGSLHVSRAGDTVYRTEPKYLVLQRQQLAARRPSVFLIGASNVAVGFDVKDVGRLVPDNAVHNLGIGGANMTELSQVVDLVREMVPDDQLDEQTFVFGLWYGLFIDDATRWRGGPTDIDVERLRYGLYRQRDGKLEPLLSPSAFRIAVLALHPFLVADVLIKGSLKPIRWWFEKGEAMRKDLNSAALDDRAKATKLAEWRQKVGTPDGRLVDEQFARLITMVRQLADKGAKVVLIDLPMPRWHLEGSPYTADYRQRLAKHLSQVSDLPNVTYHDLRQEFDDAEFYDEVHPRPRRLQDWARELAYAVLPSGSANPQ